MLFFKITSGGTYGSVTGTDTDILATKVENHGPHSMTYLLSPSTTSEVFVQPYFGHSSSAGGIVYYNSGGGRPYMTLMEIGA